MSKKVKTIIIILIIVVIGVFIYYHTKPVPKGETLPLKPVEENSTPVLISTKTIKEENFSGTIPVISGSSVVASSSRAYVDEQVSEFRKQANTDVPPMRAEFGVDSPTANYEIDIDAKYIKGEKAESVVLNVYTYTGGAHGSSFYKVFTASLFSGKILPLADVIKKDKQDAFTALLKKELIAWRPEGSSVPVVFEEDVNGLKFDALTNWSMENKNDKNLILYFDQYEIGPGALGAVAFPLPFIKIKDFLEPNFSM